MESTTVVEIYSDLNIPATSMLASTLVLFVSLPILAIAGFVVGRRVRTKRLQAGLSIDNLVGETTLGAFLALLGLLLAFTFGNALSHFNDRKVAMTEEANALGTAFLRADVLSDPVKTELKTALLDYARSRVIAAPDRVLAEDTALAKLEHTLQLQAKLWPLALKGTADPVPAAMRSFVLGSINDVIDAHMIRIAALSLPISKFANAMMFVSALAAVFLLGNRAGIVGRNLTWRTFFFSGFLFLVMLTIVDTQRATEGFIIVDETPLKATIYDMEMAMR